MIWGLHFTDIIAITAYFMLTVWIGFRAAKKIKTQEDYFLGGRQFGKLIQTFAAFGQGTSAESVVTTTSAAGKSGAAGGWLTMATGVLFLPFVWFIPVIMRRLRLLNMADFFVDRYQSASMAAFYAITQAIFFMLVAAMGFKAMTATISAIAVKPVAELTIEEKQEYDRALRWEELENTPAASLDVEMMNELETLRLEKPKREFSHVNENALMIIVGIIILLYAISGGLEAAFITDLVQGIFILLLTVILIPFIWIRIVELTGHSPFTAMHTELPKSMLELFGSPQLTDLTWYYLLAFSTVAGVNMIAQANQMTASGSAKDDTTARIGFFTGVVIKRFSTVVWIFIGLCTVILYGETVQNPDFIWGYATRDLLGGLQLGLVGFMIAALTAALMSTADALMLTTSSLITNNVYRLIARDKPESHYVVAGQIFCVVYLVGGISIAMYSGGIVELFKFMALFNAIVAAAVWMGLLWRRANPAAAWASMGASFCLFLALPLLIPLIPGVRTLEPLHATTTPIIEQHTYLATKGDALKRSNEIEEWRKNKILNTVHGKEPAPVEAGTLVDANFEIPATPIFWSSLERNVEGETVGAGLLNVELLMLQTLGFDLSARPPSFNKTIAILLKLIIPFGVLFAVGMLTKPQDKRHLDVFYAKLRTPVNASPDIDAKEMALTEANPARFDSERLFPNTAWEFSRWNKEDWMGILYSALAMIGIIGLLWGMLNIGR